MSELTAGEAFAAAHHAQLVRSAYLLVGESHAAQDLAQDTLVQVLQKWRKVESADHPAAYARRVMLNLFLTGQRRRWHGETPSAELPDRPRADDPNAAADERDVLRRALRALPPRQRAAVVLRHYEQLSEAQTAHLLGCSAGTVKSLTSRGLAALRVTALLDRVEAQ